MITPEQYEQITQRIVDVVGEHSLNYVVIAEVESQEEMHTVAIWHGGMNTALGLVERGKMRMLETAKRHDFPSSEEH